VVAAFACARALASARLKAIPARGDIDLCRRRTFLRCHAPARVSLGEQVHEPDPQMPSGATSPIVSNSIRPSRRRDGLDTSDAVIRA
jgi:hypothetical protein